MANSYGQNPMENSWISVMKFSWDISALRGCCAMKFLYALEIDQGYIPSAHPNWDGVPSPLKILIVKIKNLA